MARLLAEQKLLAPSALSSPSLHHHHPSSISSAICVSSTAPLQLRLVCRRNAWLGTLPAQHPHAPHPPSATTTASTSPPLYPRPPAISRKHTSMRTQHRYPLSLVASSSGDPSLSAAQVSKTIGYNLAMTNPAEVLFPVRPAAERCQDGRIQDQDHQDVQEPKVHKQLSRIHLFCARQPSFPGVITVFRRGRGDSHSSLRSSATNAPAPPPPSATPVRTAYKRNAAQAAQQNIQQLHQSYADFDGFDTSDTASSSKKKRLSNGVLTKVEQDSISRPSTPSSAPPTTTHPRKAARKQASQSTSSAARTPAPLRGRRFQDDQGVVWELQVGSCQAAHNRNWRKCVHCITKRAGDTCRFVDFRAFQVDPHTDKITPPDQDHTSHPAFLFSPDSDEVMDLPTGRAISPRTFPKCKATSPERSARPRGRARARTPPKRPSKAARDHMPSDVRILRNQHLFRQLVLPSLR